MCISLPHCLMPPKIQPRLILWSSSTALAETHCPLLHTRTLFQTTKVVNISNGMKITFLSSFLAKHCIPTLSSRRYESLLIIKLALRSKVISTTEKKKRTLKRCRRYPFSTSPEKFTEVPTVSPQHYTCAKGTRFIWIELLLTLNSRGVWIVVFETESNTNQIVPEANQIKSNIE